MARKKKAPHKLGGYPSRVKGREVGGHQRITRGSGPSTDYVESKRAPKPVKKPYSPPTGPKSYGTQPVGMVLTQEQSERQKTLRGTRRTRTFPVAKNKYKAGK